ncbi:Trm112 family protein [Streptomyces sp. NPDC059788]|uniref:Trm112 family protein n=1 Tax=Streptomyces sp. NPDC059788 TaxID=3346948 RepID=UPI00365ECF1A
MLDADLVSVLACPYDGAALTYATHTRLLTCQQCRGEFEVRQRIPVLVPELARQSAGNSHPRTTSSRATPDLPEAGG